MVCLFVVCVLQVGQKYHVLCVMTDGIINDMVSYYCIILRSIIDDD